ncbi:hypothetical protein ACTXT7_015481, partial [Hymenolepis weldensis]
MEKINDDIDKENDPSSSSLLVKSSQLLGNCTKPKENQIEELNSITVVLIQNDTNSRIQSSDFAKAGRILLAFRVVHGFCHEMFARALKKCEYEVVIKSRNLMAQIFGPEENE